MSFVAHRSMVLLTMFALAFSIISCASAPHIGVGHMHHSTHAVTEHVSHAHSLTLATLSFASLFVTTLGVVVLAWFMRESVTPRSVAVLPILHEPPRKKKLRRTLFSLRSPPLHSI